MKFRFETSQDGDWVDDSLWLLCKKHPDKADAIKEFFAKYVAGGSVALEYDTETKECKVLL